VFKLFFQVFTVITTFHAVVLSPSYAESLGVTNSSNTYNPDEIVMVESGHLFHNGLAVVCLKNDRKTEDTLIIADCSNPFKYNYIDTSGTLLNNSEYLECLPFNNGTAIVKTEKGFSFIDKRGRKFKNLFFDEIRKDSRGYYHTTNEIIVRGLFWGSSIEYAHGLVSPSLKEIYKCEFEGIGFNEPGNFYLGRNRYGNRKKKKHFVPPHK
jgi:hypothetical protein